MKKRLLIFKALVLLSAITVSCDKGKLKEYQINLNFDNNFPEQSKLDSIKNGTLDFGSKEINKDMISRLEYQKRAHSGNMNGVVLTKEFLTQSVNGFSGSGINMPLDSSNYDKWDFLIVYPGLEINNMGDEKLKAVTFFYKAVQDRNGNLVPGGLPVKDVRFLGGGGGEGKQNSTTPPPY